MKNLKMIACIVIGLLINFHGNQLFAQWQVDKANGFKIKLPAQWTKSTYMDGTDKVYDYYSPDENAAVQLRVFQAGAGVTTDLLVQAYEEGMLPAGTQKQSLKDHISKNGIPGKQGIYMMNYNGVEVGMAAFYTMQNNKGYVLTAIIPTSMMQQKGEEVRQITQSFTIDGFQPTQPITPTTAKTITPNSTNQSRSGARPTGNTGSRNTQSNTNTSTSSKNKIEGKYYLKSRSDHKSLTNYHFIEIKSNGTYLEEYSPKNSGNYISKNTGTWKMVSGRIILYFKDGTESGKYIWEGNDLTRWSDNNIIFRFSK